MMRTRIFALAALSTVALFAAATPRLGAPAAAEHTQAYASIEIDTLGLRCDGDSASAVLRTTDGLGGAPVPGQTISLSFVNNHHGTILDPRTGQSGESLVGVTNRKGEWRVRITPPAGTKTVFQMVIGSDRRPGPFNVACPFPDDDAYSLNVDAFWDRNRDGVRERWESDARRLQIGLGALGCCNFGAQIPPHWDLTSNRGRASWNGLITQESQQRWELCLPANANYRIVSVAGVPVDSERECHFLAPLEPGVNRVAVGLARR